ncbi:unnamed protein product [Parascedosporium putredinis]|uniref:Vacuolar-sorting protein SNF8 n=1 Tax=Parascedosporium putredinis TaxID=1442378 RepID=A0A9P1HAJ6_9PEZI|nr:unnamed protein product [Parascedosporium putredinis]CAI8002950.1 unnamed protein product [Parascedosporium putredinis]
MSRKGVGIGAFDRSRLTSAQFASKGTTLRTANAQALDAQLSVFRSLLQQFAQTHAKDIRSNPSFRAQFARMCAAIGLAVRVVEVCGETRGENGGLIGLREASERISKARGEGASAITEDDVLRAVETLKPLGSSYSIIHVGSKPYIRSVPRELNTDQSSVLEAAQVLGYVTVEMLVVNLDWPQARAQTAIEDLMSDGMLWVDKQIRPWEYWSPGFMVDVDETSLQLP